MGQIIVRNLDDSVIERLKAKAKELGLSLEETVRRALAEIVKPDEETILKELERIRAMSPPIVAGPFSQDLIREDRDTR